MPLLKGPCQSLFDLCQGVGKTVPEGEVGQGAGLRTVLTSSLPFLL